jgi:hypothetical protein
MEKFRLQLCRKVSIPMQKLSSDAASSILKKIYLRKIFGYPKRKNTSCTFFCSIAATLYLVSYNIT